MTVNTLIAFCHWSDNSLGQAEAHNNRVFPVNLGKIQRSMVKSGAILYVVHI